MFNFTAFRRIQSLQGFQSSHDHNPNVAIPNFLEVSLKNFKLAKQIQARKFMSLTFITEVRSSNVSVK